MTAVFILSLLYLWSTLFPGRISPEAVKYFSPDDACRGRQYNQVLRLTYIGNFLLNTVFLIWFAFSGKASVLSRWAHQFSGGVYWGGLLIFSLITWLIVTSIHLPFSFISGYYWEKRWGVSTQSLGAWWLDFFKGMGIDLILFTAGVLLLFWIIGRWPRLWWLIGAAFFSLWLIIQVYLWPVVVSPLFNRFAPVKHPAVAAVVRELARKADLPVEQVLVMDASRRTTQANASFSGLGRTKRIVLYDNLLANYPLEEIKAVVAHEMAHWKKGHIVKGLVLGILGSLVLWLFLFRLLNQTLPPGSHGAPHVLVLVLLFFSLTSFISSPLQNHISRGMEKEADRLAIQLTGDVPAAVRLQVNIARKNLSDVSPPAFIQWFSYSHPPAPDRIAGIQRAGGNE
ncbi:MAG: M48 family metallopeptidase [Peptococcaceae bacterium]|nr:M48 family metallopeptidase [Peptococcaceae bacterium]MDH7523853.1 M48 family metallopeptidase [Peptococcaceae bacterium]